jgi:hypothetical protein
MEKLREWLARKPLWLRKVVAIAITSFCTTIAFLWLARLVYWRLEIGGIKAIWWAAIAPAVMVIIFAVLFIRWQPDDE